METLTIKFIHSFLTSNSYSHYAEIVSKMDRISMSDIKNIISEYKETHELSDDDFVEVVTLLTVNQ